MSAFPRRLSAAVRAAARSSMAWGLAFVLRQVELQHLDMLLQEKVAFMGGEHLAVVVLAASHEGDEVTTLLLVVEMVRPSRHSRLDRVASRCARRVAERA